MDDILENLSAPKQHPAALASLVWNNGSIPMSERAKMLVLEGGDLLGTIGGGCLEAEILSVGRKVIDDQTPVETRYTMTEKRAGESGLNCGGTVRIFTEPVTDQTRQVFARVAAARQQRHSCAVATVLGPVAVGQKVFFDQEGTAHGVLAVDGLAAAVAAQLPEFAASGKARIASLTLTPAQAKTLGLAADTPLEVFVEPYLPTPLLVVFGGGHVGGQIARTAAAAGFRVVIVDDRAYFASAQRHPTAERCVVADAEEAFANLLIDEQTFIVAATRGHQQDEEVIERAIRTPARYIGMLGSERKKLILWKRIAARGGDVARLDQVHAPVGLNIGADTPEEIAVSVVAELIAVRRGPTKVWKTKTAVAAL